MLSNRSMLSDRVCYGGFINLILSDLIGQIYSHGSIINLWHMVRTLENIVTPQIAKNRTSQLVPETH